MPFYTYYCLDCRKRFDVFMTYAEYGTSKDIHCTTCQGTHTRRAINRVRVLRNDESRMEELADPAALEGLENDPQALGRMMRQMKDQVGEEMPAEFDEVVDRLEKGQSPEDIEKAIPDLAQGMDGAGGGLDGGEDY